MRRAARIDAGQKQIVTDQRVLRFFVPGVPVPKARARTVTANGRTHTYTPDRTAAWEDEIVRAFRAAYPDHGPYGPDVPVRMEVEVICPGRGKWARIRGDADNYYKLVADAMNTWAYHDDRQIVEATVTKRRARRGEFPGVWVHIEAL